MEGINDLHQKLARWNKNRLTNGKRAVGFEIANVAEIRYIDLFIAKRICADIPIWLVNHYDYMQSYFNKIRLFRFPELCKSFKQIINSDLQEALFQLVLLSRDIKGIEVASSNAISFLNSSGFQFLNRDMHGIKVPFADLSCSYFYNTNLEGSDLSHANIAFSCLEFSSFKGCNMANCSHGWVPLVELKRCKEVWFSPLRKYLVLCFDLPNCFEIHKLDKNEIDKYKNPHYLKNKVIQFSPQENYIIAETPEKVYYIHSILNNDYFKGQLFGILTEFAFSASEKYFSYILHNTLCIKDLQTNLICYKTSFQNILYCINWSPIENFLLVQCAGYWILWDIKFSTTIQQFNFGISWKDYGRSFSFSRKGKFFAVYDSSMLDDNFSIWSSQTKSLKMVKTRGKEKIKINFSPICEKIFVKSGNHFSIWNAETSEELARSKDYYNDPSSADFIIPSWDKILISNNSELGMYNFNNNSSAKCINYYDFEFNNYKKTMRSPQFVLGELLLQIDYTFINNLYEFLFKNSNPSNSGCFSSDDKYFATCNYKEISIWDMKTKEITSVIKSGDRPASMLFSPSSKLLVVKSSIEEPIGASIWNWRKKQIIWKHCFATPVRVIAFSRSEKFLAIGSGSVIYIWKNNFLLHIIDNDLGISKTAILCGAFTYCENYFLYGNDKGEIMYLSLSSKKIEKTVILENARMMVFSNSSQYIAIYGRNNSLKVWNVINKPLIIYEANELSRPQSILWSSDSNYIILQKAGDQSFEILDVLKGCVIFRSKNLIRKIDWISWSPSGNFIIAGSLGFIGIWNFKTLIELMENNRMFNDEKSLSEIDCLYWASSSNALNIRKCDFSNANMSNKNRILFKEILVSLSNIFYFNINNFYEILY